MYRDSKRQNLWVCHTPRSCNLEILQKGPSQLLLPALILPIIHWLGPHIDHAASICIVCNQYHNVLVCVKLRHLILTSYCLINRLSLVGVAQLVERLCARLLGMDILEMRSWARFSA